MQRRFSDHSNLPNAPTSQAPECFACLRVWLTQAARTPCRAPAPRAPGNLSLQTLPVRSLAPSLCPCFAPTQPLRSLAYLLSTPLAMPCSGLPRFWPGPAEEASAASFGHREAPSSTSHPVPELQDPPALRQPSSWPPLS